MMDRPLDCQIFHNTNSLRCVPIASSDCWTANTPFLAEMTARAGLIFTCIRSSRDPQDLAITNDFLQVLYCNMCWQTTPRSASMFSVPFIDVYIPSHGSPPATTTSARNFFQTCLPDFCPTGDANVSPDPQSLLPPSKGKKPLATPLDSGSNKNYKPPVRGFFSDDSKTHTSGSSSQVRRQYIGLPNEYARPAKVEVQWKS